MAISARKKPDRRGSLRRTDIRHGSSARNLSRRYPTKSTERYPGNGRVLRLARCKQCLNGIRHQMARGGHNALDALRGTLRLETSSRATRLRCELRRTGGMEARGE